MKLKKTISIIASVLALSSAQVFAAKKTDKAKNANILIAYFTRPDNVTGPVKYDANSEASVRLYDQNGNIVGNVAVVASFIQSEIGGDLYSIRVKEKYTNDFLKLVDIALDEKRKNVRPALADKVKDFDKYDVIFLGFANWWETMPMAVATFLESYDFSGKTIVPFASGDCGSGGFGRGLSDIKKLAPNAKVESGFEILGRNVNKKSGEKVEAWLKKNGYVE